MIGPWCLGVRIGKVTRQIARVQATETLAMQEAIGTVGRQAARMQARGKQAMQEVIGAGQAGWKQLGRVAMEKANMQPRMPRRRVAKNSLQRRKGNSQQGMRVATQEKPDSRGGQCRGTGLAGAAEEAGV